MPDARQCQLSASTQILVVAIVFICKELSTNIVADCLDEWIDRWIDRVATNLENMECVCVLDFSEHGELRKFLGNFVNSVQPQGKIVTNKVFLVHHSNIFL